MSVYRPRSHVPHRVRAGAAVIVALAEAASASAVIAATTYNRDTTATHYRDRRVPHSITVGWEVIEVPAPAEDHLAAVAWQRDRVASLYRPDPRTQFRYTALEVIEVPESDQPETGAITNRADRLAPYYRGPPHLLQKTAPSTAAQLEVPADPAVVETTRRLDRMPPLLREEDTGRRQVSQFPVGVLESTPATEAVTTWQRDRVAAHHRVPFHRLQSSASYPAGVASEDPAVVEVVTWQRDTVATHYRDRRVPHSITVGWEVIEVPVPGDDDHLAAIAWNRDSVAAHYREVSQLQRRATPPTAALVEVPTDPAVIETLHRPDRVASSYRSLDTYRRQVSQFPVGVLESTPATEAVVAWSRDKVAAHRRDPFPRTQPKAVVPADLTQAVVHEVLTARKPSIVPHLRDQTHLRKLPVVPADLVQPPVGDPAVAATIYRPDRVAPHYRDRTPRNVFAYWEVIEAPTETTDPIEVITWKRDTVATHYRDRRVPHSITVGWEVIEVPESTPSDPAVVEALTRRQPSLAPHVRSERLPVPLQDRLSVGYNQLNTNLVAVTTRRADKVAAHYTPERYHYTYPAVVPADLVQPPAGDPAVIEVLTARKPRITAYVRAERLDLAIADRPNIGYFSEEPQLGAIISRQVDKVAVYQRDRSHFHRPTLVPVDFGVAPDPAVVETLHRKDRVAVYLRAPVRVQRQASVPVVLDVEAVIASIYTRDVVAVYRRDPIYVQEQGRTPVVLEDPAVIGSIYTRDTLAVYLRPWAPPQQPQVLPAGLLEAYPAVPGTLTHRVDKVAIYDRDWWQQPQRSQFPVGFFDLAVPEVITGDPPLEGIKPTGTLTQVVGNTGDVSQVDECVGLLERIDDAQGDVGIVDPDAGGELALITTVTRRETFETLGYDLPWTVGTSTGPSLVDPDAEPPLGTVGWGTRCLRVESVSTVLTNIQERLYAVPTLHKFTFDCEMWVEAAPGINNALIVLDLATASAINFLRVMINNNGGTLEWRATVRHNGLSNNFTTPLSLDTQTAISFTWNTVAATWSLSIGGSVLGSGTLTGDGLTYMLSEVQVGRSNNAPTITGTWYYDNIDIVEL